MELPVHLLVMRFQNPRVSQCVAVVEHFLEMISAKSFLIGLSPHIAFHVGGAGAKDKIQKILFHIAFDKAEWALVLRVYGVV